MVELLLLLTLLSAALLTGNEFTVGVFVHRAFNRLPDTAHILCVSELARIFGRVMPLWMGGNVLLCFLSLFIVAARFSASWWLFVAATILYVSVIFLNVLALVPINNQVATWGPQNSPKDWRELRRQ